MPAGLYLGHGVMPLPQRLLHKTINLEFVEIQEILPEAWLTDSNSDFYVKCCSGAAASGAKKRHPPVTNIFT